MSGEIDNCHPLLRGGRREKGYSHGLTSSQMKEMAAICEALLPPSPLDSINKENPENHTIVSFHEASGSNHPFPDEVSFTSNHT